MLGRALLLVECRCCVGCVSLLHLLLVLLRLVLMLLLNLLVLLVLLRVLRVLRVLRLETLCVAILMLAAMSCQWPVPNLSVPINIDPSHFFEFVEKLLHTLLVTGSKCYGGGSVDEKQADTSFE